MVKDAFFPADLVLLTSSNPDGICYVETINLDGESNLKIKQALDQTRKMEESSLPSFKACAATNIIDQPVITLSCCSFPSHAPPIYPSCATEGHAPTIIWWTAQAAHLIYCLASR